MALKLGWLQPDGISPAAVFLASDSAATVAGAEYEVTGGDRAKNIWDKEESSFLKKRSKRLLSLCSLRMGGHGRDPSAGAGIKVFWFRQAGFRLFFRKERLTSLRRRHMR